MHADYVPNPLYDNNPFIEALPPMLSGKDLIRALAVIPPYSDSDRDRSTGERLQLLSSLYEFYQPLWGQFLCSQSNALRAYKYAVDTASARVLVCKGCCNAAHILSLLRAIFPYSA